jgi:IS4 transposase
MFDWAKYRRTKGAIKLHLLLDHDGYLPSFAVVTEGKTSEIKVARTLRFDPGTILAIDRGYIDYEWFRELTQQEVYFVTRMKEKAVYDVKEELEVPQNRNVVRDQIIWFPRLAREGEEPVLFRRVEILDVEKQGTIVFLTNLLAFGATTIAAIYKDRWQVELFFKALKQTLKIKTFVGTSANAVRLDGSDRDAGAEVPAIEIEVLLVIIDAGRTAAAAAVLLPRSVGVAGRSFSGPAGTGRSA